MRNIAPVESIYKMRTYDIKGCIFLRKTNVNNNLTEKELTKVTLKDVDFKDLENNKININKEVAEKCKIQMKKDANFLASLNFFDYSLLVFKINYGQKYKD